MEDQRITGMAGSPSATTSIDGKYLPPPPPKFGGEINLSAEESKPFWPPTVVAPKGAPNVLLIMTDDQGYGVSSTFGGVVPTPAMDRIAQAGLRYTQFHSTALCSPSRAALICGRNHHSVGFGQIGELSTGYPGYNSIIGPDNATIAEILKQNGYATSWFGKEHDTPAFQYSMAGPFDQWPVGMGFDYFYGFMGGETDQWTPYLFRNQTQIFPWVDKPGYNLTTDMADEAIKYMGELNAAAPDKPFFLYYVPGGSHTPHHPTPEWIEKISNMHLFDKGWQDLRERIFANQQRLGVIPPGTQLTPWPKDILPEWDTLPDENKKLFTRQADIFGAYTAYTDHEIGRVIQAIEDMGKLDNTLIIYISGDNGTSAEGTLVGTPNQYTAYNGVLDLPVAAQMKAYDAWGSDQTYPHISQKPIEGVSMTYTFDKDNANIPSIRETQYFEMFGNRAIYHNGWIAATTPPEPPWLLGSAALPEVVNGYQWELYNIAEDYSQNNDLAAKFPDKLRELQELFFVEATKYNVFPLDNSVLPRIITPRPSATAGRTLFTYSGEVAGLPVGNAPSLLNKSYTITAEVEVPQGGADGMLATMGGRFGGYGLYLLKGKPVFTYNALGLARFRWEGSTVLTPNSHTIMFDFKYDGPGPGKGGTGVLSVDGKTVASQSIPHTIPFLMSIDETFDVGVDTRTPVDDNDYQVPFRFTGKLSKLTFQLGPEELMPEDHKAKAEAFAQVHS